MKHWTKWLVVLAAPMLLASCVLVPGKFISTLDIRADRTFTFTYKGEVIGIDMAKDFAKGMGDLDKDKGDGDDSDGGDGSDSSLSAYVTPASFQNDSSDDSSAQSDAKFRAIAAALSKEAGYRSVTYKGDGVFDVDYAITGKLSYNFVYPYNMDAEAIFPFVVIELRGNSNVRMKAPGFAKDDDQSGGMGGDSSKAASRLDGTFTLTTDAEIVSQNNEDGSTKLPDGRRQIQWRATPLTKDAPSAVLKLQPLGG